MKLQVQTLHDESTGIDGMSGTVMYAIPKYSIFVYKMQASIMYDAIQVLNLLSNLESHMIIVSTCRGLIYVYSSVSKECLVTKGSYSDALQLRKI